MNRLQQLSAHLQESLRQGTLLKVISGLQNFDATSVERVANAACLGKADLLDIACDPDLVKLAITVSKGLPVCVSSIDPELFVPAVDSGAVVAEIGNFDSFYQSGRIFDSNEVLELTIKTRKLIPETVLSVTVPHTLSLVDQGQLAVDLVNAGADLIQTEGGTSTSHLSSGILGLIEKASPTIASSYCICNSLQDAGYTVPVICASGLSSVTAPMAIASGASGVGIGSAVNKLTDEVAMVSVVRAIKESIDLTASRYIKNLQFA